MDTSLFLAKFWGWYLIIFFFILSLNPKRIKQIFNDLKDEKFLIVSSFMDILVGLLNILFHNILFGTIPFCVPKTHCSAAGIT